MMRWRAGAVMVVAAALLPGGCRRGPASAPRPVLADVKVSDGSPRDRSVRVDVDAIQKQLRSRLEASGIFEPSGGGNRPGATVRLQLDAEAVEVEERGIATARLRLFIDTRPENAPGALEGEWPAAAEQRYVASPPPAGGAAAVLTSLVVRTAGALVDEIAAAERMKRATPAEIHAALVARDGGELRLQAIRVVAARNLRGEVPALLDLLNDPDERTRDTALGALIQMRERGAVPVLTRSRSFKDARELRKVIEAVSVIGGDEARSFLEFVADTNDDPETRRLAAEARARLARREGRD